MKLRLSALLSAGAHRIPATGIFLPPPDASFLREDVLNAVWGRDIHVERRTVDVHIRRLREAINGPGEIDIVRTVRAAGYALDLETVA